MNEHDAENDNYDDAVLPWYDRLGDDYDEHDVKRVMGRRPPIHDDDDDDDDDESSRRLAGRVMALLEIVERDERHRFSRGEIVTVDIQRIFW